MKKLNTTGKLNNNSLPSGSWHKTAEAAEKLQIHYKTLQNLMYDGFLEPRVHFIRVGSGVRSPYLWNVDQIMLRMGDFASPSSRS